MFNNAYNHLRKKWKSWSLIYYNASLMLQNKNKKANFKCKILFEAMSIVCIVNLIISVTECCIVSVKQDQRNKPGVVVHVCNSGC
jgi:hypothetical protein